MDLPERFTINASFQFKSSWPSEVLAVGLDTNSAKPIT
ncbi:hypothetical protein BLA29_014665, partial [Euroglyphus maynei]